jgi:medium-chain acyl-[acyl-carrier-protein] hydrolase
MESIVAGLFDALFADGHDLPFALFGHSMGALVAYAPAQQIADRGGVPPVAVLVSAARPPGSPSAIDMSMMRDEERLDALVALGGTPAELANICDLMRLMIPSTA